MDDCVHLEVYTYYGASRTRNVQLLAEHDFVLTTYQTLSADFSKVSPIKHQIGRPLSVCVIPLMLKEAFTLFILT